MFLPKFGRQMNRPNNNMRQNGGFNGFLPPGFMPQMFPYVPPMINGPFPRMPYSGGNFNYEPQQRNTRGDPYLVRGKRRTSASPGPSPNKKRAKLQEENGESARLLSMLQISGYHIPICSGSQDITEDIWKYFMKAQMTSADLKKKLELRKSLHSVVLELIPNCRLFIVGSSMTGFATKTSDVDMCLMISTDEVEQKREATVLLEIINKAFKQCSFLTGNMVIKAKVPILKFFDKVSGVECDLNINNIIGIRNTHLLRYYAYMDWRVRPLMLYIKRWARFHDINDASKRTISSYSLSLMLIHFLQVGPQPEVLPCLQRLNPELFNAMTDVRELSLNFNNQVRWKSENDETLGELFLGFLCYYARIFDFDHSAVSVSKGKAIYKSLAVRLDPTKCMSQWKCLCIEEPFEGSNTARSVYDPHVFWRILRVFRKSYEVLAQTRDPAKLFLSPF